jgi:signal transduction histidine kinase
VAIIGNFSSIALRKDSPASYLKTINITAHHAESLLNDASLLARLEKEGGLFPIVPVDLADMTAEAAELFRDDASRRGVEIVFVNKTGSPVLGSRTALRQVLVNLVSNAVKYNRDNGKVSISMDDRDKWVDISITDEGCGIRRDELSRIFEKFYRAGGSERIKGAGLGLYIVKLLAEAMGGKITVASNPGAGSTFTLSLQKLHTSVQSESMPDGMLISSTLSK